MPIRIPPAIRRPLGRLRRRLRPESDQPGRPSEWRVEDTEGPALTVTAVADLALLQGVTPGDVDAASVTVELDGGPARRLVPVDEWFPVPGADDGAARAFRLTLDAEDLDGAVRARLHCGASPGPWHPLPSVRTPRGMPGEEALESCPACGGVGRTPVGRRQGLEMQRCTGCGLVMTSPRPAEDKTLVRYGRNYFEAEYLPAQADTAALRAHNDALLDLLDSRRRPGATLFELGVGGGLLLDRAMERGWKVAGSDVNEAAVEHVGARGHDVWVANVDHADSLGGPYAAVVSEMSLEHVRRPDHALRLAADALEPGGALLVYTVCPEGESFRVAGMASYLVGPAEHLFLFSEASLVELCESAGLVVEHRWRDETGDDVGVVAGKPR